jgi:hypothetical protein
MSAKKRLNVLSYGAVTVFCLMLAAPVAQAAPPDVGLVTGLSGELTYWNPKEKQPPAKAQAFLKIRRGDHLKLAGGAVAQLTYFTSGRQETWKGPATLIVGDIESQAAGKMSHSPSLEVKILSSKVAQKMSSAPMAVNRSASQTSGIGQIKGEQLRSSGVIQTMAPRKALPPPPAPRPLAAPDKKAVAEAEKVYQDLKKQAKADDLTPEIYLLSVYADYKLYGKMEQVIAGMLTKRPDDPNLKKLKAWARSQVSRQP